MEVIRLGRRHKISRSGSKKYFSSASGSHPKNGLVGGGSVMRGGIRL